MPRLRLLLLAACACALLAGAPSALAAPDLLVVQGASDLDEGMPMDTRTFSVELTADPGIGQTVDVDVTPDDQVYVDTYTMTFTHADWNVPQVVTVYVIDDAVDEASPHTAFVDLDSWSTVPAFDGLYEFAVFDVSDDDAADLLVSDHGGVAVAEGGATDTFDVSLTSEPTATVTVDIAGVASQVGVDQSQLVFTPANWNVPQTVTVTAIDDVVSEASPHPGLVRFTVTSADLMYDGLAVPDLSAAITDNDPADTTPPVGTIDAAPPSPFASTVTLGGTSADAGSGVSRVDLRYAGPTSGTVCLAPATPTAWSCGWDTTALPDGVYTLTLTITDVAGNTTDVTRTVLLDNNAPSGGSITYSGAVIATTSATITFVAGTDAGTGVASTVLERRTGTLAGTTCSSWGAWSTLTASPTSPYADTTLAQGSCYQYRLVQTDFVGNVATWSSSNELRVDSAFVDTQGPTGVTLTTTTVGDDVRATFSTGTDDSGIRSWKLKRTIASFDGTSCGAFDPNYGAVAVSPASPYLDTTTNPGNCYRYALEVVDTLDNATIVQSATTHSFTYVVPDSTPPVFGAFKVAPAANGGAQHWDGTTLWFNPTQAGSFALRAAAKDNDSGMAGVAFNVVGTGFSAGASSSVVGVWESIVSWTEGAGPTTIRALGTNMSGLSSTADVSARPDTTPPAGAAVSVPATVGTGEIPMTLTLGSDSESGVRGWQLQRSSAGLTAAGCGAFGPYVTIADGTRPGAFSDAVGLGTCHYWRLVVFDNVGNQAVTEPIGSIVQRVVKGSDRNDMISGKPSAEILGGGRGNDTIRGGGGDDVIGGGDGNDLLSGGIGDDRLLGGNGWDRLSGDAGNDWLDGGSGDDRLDGGPGADTLIGGPGRDTYRGGAGDDLIGALDGARDVISCGSGTDRVVADRFDQVAGDCEQVQRSTKRSAARR